MLQLQWTWLKVTTPFQAFPDSRWLDLLQLRDPLVSSLAQSSE